MNTNNSRRKLNNLSVIQDQNIPTWKEKKKVFKMHWHLSKEEKWFIIFLKMKCFECFQKAKESNESDQSFSPGFYGIKLKLESLVEILL